MFVHRCRLLFVAVALLLTAFASASETAVCPQPFADDSDVRATSIQPLLAGERLLYGIDHLAGGMLEVRYLVNGKLHLTEMLDLDSVSLPMTRETKDLMRRDGRATGAASVPRKERLHAERAIELLTLQPDSVRALHRLAREGAVLEIAMLNEGGVLETLSFAELTARSAALAKKGFVPVFASTEVSGPGLEPSARTGRVAVTEYLESCSECTYDHPCDTECGWDPGKGGPVTCGEYGAPCGGQPTCPSSYVSGEWWGPWTYYSTGYGWTHCVTNYWGGGDQYRERITTYRRERIRRTTTCPNSPSCTGCYDTEAVISVQYSQSVCWENTYFSCSFPETACCWRNTCSGGGFNPCAYTSCW